MVATRFLRVCLLLSIIGCGKTELETRSPFILAGQTDNLTYVVLGNDSLLHAGDEMDVDADTQGDFAFSFYTSQMTQAQCDSYIIACLPQLCGCMPHYTGDARIEYLAGFEVMRHADEDKPYPLPLELNDTISNAERWHEADFGHLYYTSTSSSPKGLWPYDAYKYLSFRRTGNEDTLFGWIRMKYKNGNLIISDLAYQE